MIQFGAGNCSLGQGYHRGCCSNKRSSHCVRLTSGGGLSSDAIRALMTKKLFAKLRGFGEPEAFDYAPGSIGL